MFFAEKIHDLENKLKNNEDKLRGKDRIISELEAQLEAAKFRNSYQTQIEEISMQALNICLTDSNKLTFNLAEDISFELS